MPLRSRVPQFCCAPRCRCTVREGKRIYSLKDPKFSVFYSRLAHHLHIQDAWHHLHLYSIEWKDSFGAISLGSRMVEFRTKDTAQWDSPAVSRCRQTDADARTSRDTFPDCRSSSDPVHPAPRSPRRVGPIFSVT